MTETSLLSHDSINNKHVIKVEEDFKNLPYIHWLPKVHLKPYKFRHIANSRSKIALCGIFYPQNKKIIVA